MGVSSVANTQQFIESLARVKIKIIESYGKYAALFKNREIFKNQLFNENIKGWGRCFEARPTETRIPRDKLARIVKAYNRAMNDMSRRDLYYISDEWVPIYNKYMGNVIESLSARDYAKIEKLYENFFRERLSAGLCGLPTNMERYYLKSPSIVNKYWYVMDACHRIKVLETKVDDVTAAELATPRIGNPYGIFYDGIFVRSGADYQYYYSRKISDLLETCDQKRVIEIGGGYGGMASFLMKDKTIEQYVDVDLPETLALATYYLMNAFPEERFLLYGEGNENDPLGDYRFLMLPSFAIENIQDKEFGVAFNSYSFSEMSKIAANNYIHILGKLGPKHILHVNHTRNSVTRADDFSFGDYGYSLVNKSLSEWNHGRSQTADEFEFQYVSNPAQNNWLRPTDEGVNRPNGK